MTNFPNEPIELLLVEDNPGDVRMIREALKRRGFAHNLNVASNGAEALAYLRCVHPHTNAVRPQLILLDLNMPLMNGRQFLAEQKRDAKLCSIPVIVFTSSADSHDVTGAYELHANSFVSKPMEFTELGVVLQVIEDFWLNTARLPRDDRRAS